MDPLHDPRFPNRPTHPDFWRLSEIILKLDGRLEAAQGQVESAHVFKKTVSEQFDMTSVMYMVEQRATRTANLLTTGDPLQSPTDVASMLKHRELFMAALMAYLEALLVGIEYEKAGGKQ